MNVIGHIYRDSDQQGDPPLVRTILDDGSESGLIVDGYHPDGEDVTP